MQMRKDKFYIYLSLNGDRD